MALLWKHFVLSFSALLPLVNPLGSALIFLGLVGSAPNSVYRSLARRIAVNMALFLVIVDISGQALLRFFGISLPIVEVSGGLVIAAIAWTMLHQQDTYVSKEKMQGAAEAEALDVEGNLMPKAFYPFTFPITVGPGCIVVLLTVEAHIPREPFAEAVLSRVGVLIAILVLSVSVYFCYAYSPRIAQKISPATAHGILRVIAFILFCIGVQIAWNGLEPLLTNVIHNAKVL